MFAISDFMPIFVLSIRRNTQTLTAMKVHRANHGISKAVEVAQKRFEMCKEARAKKRPMPFADAQAKAVYSACQNKGYYIDQTGRFWRVSISENWSWTGKKIVAQPIF